MKSCDPGCTPSSRVIEQRRIRTSVEGRAIMAYRIGSGSGTPVLAVGQIHGDEHAGRELADYLRDTAPVPGGFDVWTIPTLNLDGNTAGTHVNGRGVDLNRNFPPDWQPNNCATNPVHFVGPLSEPESQAIANFVGEIRPHMPSGTTARSTVDEALLHGVFNQNVLYAYAQAAGYSVTTANSSPTGYCVGKATQLMNDNIRNSSAFVVVFSTNTRGALSDRALVNHSNAIYAAAAASIA